MNTCCRLQLVRFRLDEMIEEVASVAESVTVGNPERLGVALGDWECLTTANRQLAEVRVMVHDLTREMVQRSRMAS